MQSKTYHKTSDCDGTSNCTKFSENEFPKTTLSLTTVHTIDNQTSNTMIIVDCKALKKAEA